MKNYKYLLIITNIVIGHDLNIAIGQNVSTETGQGLNGLEKELKSARNAFYTLPMVQEYEKEREQAYKDVGYSESDIKKFMTHDAPQTIIASLQKNNRVSSNDMKMVKDKGQKAIDAFHQYDQALRATPTQAVSWPYLGSVGNYKLEKNIAEYVNAENEVNNLKKTIEKLYATNNYSPEQDFVLQKKLNDAQRTMIDKEIQMNNVWKEYQKKVHKNARESNFNIDNAFKQSVEAYKNENPQKLFNDNTHLDDVIVEQMDQRNSELKMEKNRIRNLSSSWSLDNLKYWLGEVPQRVTQSYVNKVMPSSADSDQGFFSKWGSKLYNALPSVSIGYFNKEQSPSEKVDELLQESKRRQKFTNDFNKIKKLESNYKILNDQDKEYLQGIVYDLSNDPALRNAAKHVLDTNILTKLSGFKDKYLNDMLVPAAGAVAVGTAGVVLKKNPSALKSAWQSIKNIRSSKSMPSEMPIVKQPSSKDSSWQWPLNIGAIGGIGAAIHNYYGPKEQENNDTVSESQYIKNLTEENANLRELTQGYVDTLNKKAEKDLNIIKEREAQQSRSWSDIVKPWKWNWKP